MKHDLIPPVAEVQRETDEQRARRIEIANHVYQIARGDKYRCQFCQRESFAALWKDINTCPLCGRVYDAILAQDEEE